MAHHDHSPVMLHEVMEMFAETRVKNPKNYLDGTFGRGGHARALSMRFPEMDIYALDKDSEALSFAHEHWKQAVQGGRFWMEQSSFSRLDSIIETHHWPESYDMILLDLGVSSPQLDQGDRGFSFYQKGPLDMRMDQSQDLKAEHIINGWDERELVELFKVYGEVFKPHKVVQKILLERTREPLSSTQQLSHLIEKAVGWKKRGKHPATPYFMALRLVVNQELEDLKEGLEVLMKRLTPGGRLAVITFHSLEDRPVKQIFKSSALGSPVNKKVIKPSWEEEQGNKRARSAKLRVFERRLSQEESSPREEKR